jgi:hypothetical protein
MANTIINDMRIYGETKELEKFREDVSAVDNIPISFNQIIPEPEDTSEFADNMLPGWRVWREKHWHTKTDAFCVKFESRGDHLFYSFCTAWGPPFAIYFTLFSTYKELTFKVSFFDECVLAFYHLEVKNGECKEFIREDAQFGVIVHMHGVIFNGQIIWRRQQPF